MRNAGSTRSLVCGTALALSGCASTSQVRTTAPPGGRVEVSAAPLKPDPAKLKQMGLTPDDVAAPVALAKPQPQYPPSALQAGTTGTVRLRCVIEMDGAVQNCEIRQSLTADCDAAAVRAVENWKYTPTKLKGTPVRAYVDIGINYLLQ
jgi:protein TonB